MTLFALLQLHLIHPNKTYSSILTKKETLDIYGLSQNPYFIFLYCIALFYFAIVIEIKIFQIILV